MLFAHLERALKLNRLLLRGSNCAVDKQHYAMLQRNLLYTGMTRGKRLVVLVGQKKAVAIAVRNVSGRRRWSKLNEWLAAHCRDTQLPEPGG